ncbi:MAG: S4 domain-containing protein [Flavobacteriales bacterium]|jgi:ribosome-associated heat shock protein Hsp15|nr:S4 domain-containing protein [Flavobacteriales bacterium]
MRVDKYLWSIRLFKTRTLATDACRDGRIAIGEDVVKAARDVKVGDKISIRRGAIHFQWKVVAIPNSRVGAALVPTYAEDITSEDERRKLEMIRLGQEQRPRGLGRPTKKDRRNWDDFFFDSDDDEN